MADIGKAQHGVAKASLIAELIFNHVIDKDRLARTGSIAPANSLRPKRAREAFARVERSRRFFTKSAVENAVRILIDKYVEAPKMPGHTTDEWVASQAKSLHYLLKRAVKNSWNRDYMQQRSPNKPPALNSEIQSFAAMDDLETQPYFWDAEASLDRHVPEVSLMSCLTYTRVFPKIILTILPWKRMSSRGGRPRLLPPVCLESGCVKL